jgi:hypothetical protein
LWIQTGLDAVSRSAVLDAVYANKGDRVSCGCAVHEVGHVGPQGLRDVMTHRTDRKYLLGGAVT